MNNIRFTVLVDVEVYSGTEFLLVYTLASKRFNTIWTGYVNGVVYRIFFHIKFSIFFSHICVSTIQFRRMRRAML